MLLMIDNYDSFTYNLVQYLGELGADVRVFRNDAITLEVLERLSGKIPILGVCLGHQAIGQAFGGKVIRAKQVMHGKVSRIRHDGQGVFSGVPDDFVATRYHSLVIERSSLPACLTVTAQAEDGEIMGVRHTSLAVEGVQFHPEAMLTEHGHRLLENFLKGRTQ